MHLLFSAHVMLQLTPTPSAAGLYSNNLTNKKPRTTNATTTYTTAGKPLPLIISRQCDTSSNHLHVTFGAISCSFFVETVLSIIHKESGVCAIYESAIFRHPTYSLCEWED
jgi:hypothetical protein